MSSAYFGAVPASQASKQTVWGIGGTYKAGRGQYYLGYTNSRLDVANYHNDVVYVGTRYNLNDALQFIGTLHYDWLKHATDSGKRLTTAAMLDYSFSKRTDVYVEVDYTHLNGAWIALNVNPNFSNPGNTFGNNSRLGVMTGIRHKF